LEKKYDKITGVKEVQLTNDELSVHLKMQGVKNPSQNKKLQQLCVRKGLPTKKMVIKIIEGWVGKPKGSLQKLFERVWVDITRLSEYTISGKKNDFGNRIEGTSLTQILKQQSDFAVEETLLQQHGHTLGIRVE
jgi:hypothetical protein